MYLIHSVVYLIHSVLQIYPFNELQFLLIKLLPEVGFITIFNFTIFRGSLWTGFSEGKGEFSFSSLE